VYLQQVDGSRPRYQYLRVVVDLDAFRVTTFQWSSVRLNGFELDPSGTSQNGMPFVHFFWILLTLLPLFLVVFVFLPPSHSAHV